jgi:hypothetical protein
MEVKTNTNIISVKNEKVPTPEWMQLAIAPIITRHTHNKSNPLHDKSGLVA